MTIKAWGGALLALICGWIAVLMTVMVLSDKAPSAMVLFPDDRFIAALPEGTAIVSASRYAVLLKNDTPGFTRQLYRSGARAVLPGGLMGCFRPA